MKKLRVVAMIEMVAPPEPGFETPDSVQRLVEAFLEKKLGTMRRPGKTVTIPVASEEIEDDVRPAA